MASKCSTLAVRYGFVERHALNLERAGLDAVDRRLDLLDDFRWGGRADGRLDFEAVVGDGLWLAVMMTAPPSLRSRIEYEMTGVGWKRSREEDLDAVGGQHLGDRAGEAVGPEARVEADGYARAGPRPTR